MNRFPLLYRLTTFFALCALFDGSDAAAWTSADISHVDVRVQLDERGRARVQTDARFVVNGGRFHGFDIAELPDAELVREECEATTDDERTYDLELRHLRDGRTRIKLAHKRSIRKGAVTFRIVHLIDMVEKGALRHHEDGARLDWTPIIWDHGLEWMKVTVVLPSGGAPGHVVPDPGASKDYVVEIDGATAKFLKHRAPRWYEMRVVLDAEASRFASLAPAAPPTSIGAPIGAEDESVAAIGSEGSSAPWWTLFAPALGMLLGLLALVSKHAHVARIGLRCGASCGFILLRHTGKGPRIALTMGAFALALAAQASGSIAASIPPLVAGSALWLVRRARPVSEFSRGGTWRRLDPDETDALRIAARAYRSERSSWFDLTSVRGACAFCLFASAPAIAACTLLRPWPFIGWAAVISTAIPGVAIWLHAWSAELPQDPVMEQFLALHRRFKALCGLAGRLEKNARAELWVREDASGFLEVRARVTPLPGDIRRLEIAGEPTCCGSLVRTAFTAVIGLKPNSATARKIAASPLVTEHHLTPDLSEEIVVLRNRRGRRPDLTPLVSALAPLRR